MRDFVDHPTKVIIREKWCKPLLEHVYKKFGYKFVYMGLPAQDALDIKCWIEYIKKVIVFQCRDYPQPSHPEQSKEAIEKLESLFDDFEKKGLIETYSLFDGYIEEVVLSGKDNSGNDFSQKDIVTIYNLDFCNSLTSPLEVWDWGKLEYKRKFKIEAIRKLLEIQRDISNSTIQKKFIMFLTVHSNFWEDEASKLLENIDSLIAIDYKGQVDESKLNQQEKNLRLLKLFVFLCLKQHFCDCDFIPNFFPPIYYKGSGDNNWLVCFTVIGNYYPGGKTAGMAPFNQDLVKILKDKFIFADEKDFSKLDDDKIEENEIEINPVSLFSELPNSKYF